MMIELSKEQIEAAIKTGARRLPHRKQYGELSATERTRLCGDVIAIAPYLQAKWEMPTEEEVESLFRLLDIPSISGRREYAHRLIRAFIERRNAALLPAPVDPRREKLDEAGYDRKEINAILAALDGDADANR
jgi:hypothetical protein